VKVRVPLLLTLVTAIVMALTTFVPHRLGDYASTELSQWLSIMGGWASSSA